MSRNLTASDRRSLIRLASTLEKGSEERKAILAGLKSAASDRYYTPEMDAALEVLGSASPGILKWLNDNTDLYWKSRYSDGAARGAHISFGLNASNTYTAQHPRNAGGGWWTVVVHLGAEDGKVNVEVGTPYSRRGPMTVFPKDMNASVLRSPGKLFAGANLPSKKSRKSAATRYEHNGQLMTLSQLAREAVGKDVFMDSRGRPNYNILMDRSGDSASVFRVTPSQWKKLRLPDLTSPRIKEKLLDMLLSKLKKGLSMSDAVDFNMWSKETNASKEEMVEWLKRRV